MNVPAGNLNARVHPVIGLGPTLPANDRAVQRPRPQVYRPEKRAFLFLQGPPGPMMHQLATAMRDKGVPRSWAIAASITVRPSA